MSKKPQPKFDVRAIARRDLELIDNKRAIAILKTIGAETTDATGHTDLVKYAVATVSNYVEIESKKPLTSEQNEALKRLRKRFIDLQAATHELAKDQRAQICTILQRYTRDNGLSDAVGCLNLVRDSVSTLHRHQSKLASPLRKRLEKHLERCNEFLARLDDFSEGELVIATTLALQESATHPLSADAMTRFDYCLDRLSNAIGIAISLTLKGGPQSQPGLHSSVSYLALVYTELTGKQPSYWGNELDRTMAPFHLFIDAIFEAAQHPVPYKTLAYATKAYCERRNAFNRTESGTANS